MAARQPTRRGKSTQTAKTRPAPPAKTAKTAAAPLAEPVEKAEPEAPQPGDQPCVAPQEQSRVLSVRARAARFQRAGIVFGPTPIVVSEAEVGADVIERILAEPALVCTPA